MITTIEAIQALAPSTTFQTEGNEITGWDIAEEKTGINQPTQTEIDAEQSRLQAIYDNNQYQRDRQYAPIGDQLDMLWHSIDAGEFGDTAKQSEFYTAIAAVKAEFPKP